jgi:hypothetical protein
MASVTQSGGAFAQRSKEQKRRSRDGRLSRLISQRSNRTDPKIWIAPFETEHAAAT